MLIMREAENAQARRDVLRAMPARETANVPLADALAAALPRFRIADRLAAYRGLYKLKGCPDPEKVLALHKAEGIPPQDAAGLKIVLAEYLAHRRSAANSGRGGRPKKTP